MIEIWPGDFFSVKMPGFPGWLNRNLTKTPSGKHTDEFHFGVIADPIYDDNGAFVDFETRESISKGPSTLRFFSRYGGQIVTLYRLPGITKERGLELVRSISNIGDKGYGYIDFLEALLDVFCLCVTLQFPPYSARQLKMSRNDEYICTELCAYGADSIGMPVEPPDSKDIWVIPVVYLQAVDEGRLVKYYEGDPAKLDEI
jgi:hypothetical protein